MADLHSSGIVPSKDQILHDRLRKGLCTTCVYDPVQCYKLKKSFGGLRTKKIPLTEPGKSFDGVCLRCYRDLKDGQRGGHNHQQQQRQHRQHKKESLPTYVQKPKSGQDHRRSAPANSFVEEYVENIFGEKVLVKKPKRRSEREWMKKNNCEDDKRAVSHGSNKSDQSSSESEKYSPSQIDEENSADMTDSRSAFSKSLPITDDYEEGEYNSGYGSYGEEKEEEQAPDDQNFCPVPQSDDRVYYNEHESKLFLEELEEKPDSVPTLNNFMTQSVRSKNSNSLGDDESLDALEMLAMAHIKKTKEIVQFSPGQTFVKDAELQLPTMDDDEISVFTRETAWGASTVVTVATRQAKRKSLTDIDEDGPGSGRSLTSHQIHEPPPVPDSMPSDNHSNAQDMERYLEETAPHLMTLRVIVEEMTAAGEDAGAIDVVTQALIHDNATSMSKDLALFCLTTLWVEARKNTETKKIILNEGRTFDAVIEAMQIYRDRSVAIQTRGCGIIWSLALDPNDRKYVAQLGGCQAVLNAMSTHIENEPLQIMGLGALKVLSFDNISKSTLRSHGAVAIVGDVMQNHVYHSKMQTEGCVILGNLSVDAISQSVVPVTEQEIDVVIKAMVCHPDNLEVHESACFTLMSLASTASNVKLIRGNDMSKLALELSLQKHPDEVGINILTLLRKLKFDDT